MHAHTVSGEEGMKPIDFQNFPLGHTNHAGVGPFYTEFWLGLEKQGPEPLVAFLPGFFGGWELLFLLISCCRVTQIFIVCNEVYQKWC